MGKVEQLSTDPKAIVRAIASAMPFAAWPEAAHLRLAMASKVSSHGAGVTLLVDGRHCDVIMLLVEGTALASVSSPSGRRVTFKVETTTWPYGLLPLVDGGEIPHDLISTEPVTVIRIPHAAILAELSRAPELWQAIAVEVAARARRNADQMKRFVFDAPLVHTASLLLGLAANDIGDGQTGPLTLGLRLSHERAAEMLGISRQWATSLVRELTLAGIVEWRYGRVTVRDLPALKALASQGIIGSA